MKCWKQPSDSARPSVRLGTLTYHFPNITREKLLVYSGTISLPEFDLDNLQMSHAASASGLPPLSLLRPVIWISTSIL